MATSNDESVPLLNSNSSSNSTQTEIKIRRQRPEKHSSKTFLALCILVTELCERMTFYGISANLVPFCQNVLGMKGALPSTVNYVFLGSCLFIPVFGGWLADKYMGRFNVIYGFCLIYFVGTLLLSVVGIEDATLKKSTNGSYLGQKSKIAYFVLSLVFLAFGTGGIKANVSPFGADQVKDQGPEAVEKFFIWFYWFINIGALVSYTLIVYVEQNVSFSYGFIITAGSMFLAIIAFCISRNKYIVEPPGGSILGDTFKVIWTAMKRTLRKSERPIPQIKGESWLDRAKETRGGHFSNGLVEDVKTFLRVIPIFAFFIIYWALYSQMSTSYLIQAEYMKIKFGINFPAASLSIFDIVVILIVIPIMDKVVYPLLRYSGFNFTLLRRIGLGMLVAASSLAVAGWVEIKRRERFQSGHTVVQTLFHKNVTASDMSVFYQAPQFLLIGISEVFTSTTGNEFAYSQAPRHLKGLVMGLNLITGGLGNYLSGALANIVSYANPKWFPADNPNNGYLENVFFLMAGLMVLNFFLFLIVARKYQYVDDSMTPEESQPLNLEISST